MAFPVEAGRWPARQVLVRVCGYGVASMVACTGVAACVHADVGSARLLLWLIAAGSLGLLTVVVSWIGIRRAVTVAVRRAAERVAALTCLVQGVLLGSLPLLLPGRDDRAAVGLVYVLFTVALAAAFPSVCSSSRSLFLAGPVPLLAVSGLIVTAGVTPVPWVVGPLELLLLGILSTVRVDQVIAVQEVSATAGRLAELTHDLAVQRERTASALEHLAWATEALTSHVGHDPLTGLANRGSFREHLEMAMARARRSGSHVGVLFVGFAGLAGVGDEDSQTEAGRLLVLAAGRFRHATRDGDWVARHEGAAFTVLLPGIAFAQDALMVAERVQAAMDQPFELDDLPIQLQVNIGVALDGNPTDGPDELLGHAQLALQRAGEQGGSRIERFNESMRPVIKHRCQDGLALTHDIQLDPSQTT